MPRETLEQKLIQQWEKEKTFTLPILWVDDEGVDETNLKLFSRAARAEITMIANPRLAAPTWAHGEHLALITDHRLGSYGYGYQVVEAVMQSGVAPCGLFVITSFITQPEIEQYKAIYPYIPIFEKETPYAQIGGLVRQTTLEMMAADGMMPNQLISLRNLAAQHRSRPSATSAE